MSLTKIGSIGINTGIQFAGVTTVSTLHVGSGVTLSSDGDIFATGISTFSEDIKVGSGITLSPDGDGFYTGVVTATTFSGALSGSGANITAINASNLASGTVPTARLGSGTASSSTFLRGDSTFAAVTSTTINNNADNRVITGSGTANTLEGEANLTFDGSKLTVSSTLPEIFLTDTNASNARGRLNANGGGLLLGADNDNAAADSVISFAVDGSERARLDSAGRLLVGTTTDVAGGAISSKIQVRSTSYTAAIAIVANRSASSGGNFSFTKTRGTSEGDTTIVQSGDTLGTINFFGADGTSDEANGASIYAAVDGTPGANDMPGRLILATTADGAASPTERLRITSSGDLGLGTSSPDRKLDVSGTGNVYGKFQSTNSTGAGIEVKDSGQNWLIQADNGGSQQSLAFYDLANTSYRVHMKSNGNVEIVNGDLKFASGHGIDFSATGDGSGTMTNELLDDYEEGTWSISVTPGGGSFSVSHMNARYVRIGNVVTVQGWWRAAGISGVSGALTVSGLPYAALDYSSGGGVRQTLKLDVAHVNYSGLTFVKLRIGNNSTQGSILANTAGASGGLNTWTAGNIATSSELYISGSYITG